MKLTPVSKYKEMHLLVLVEDAFLHFGGTLCLHRCPR